MDLREKISALRASGLDRKAIEGFLEELETELDELDPYRGLNPAVQNMLSTIDDFGGLTVEDPDEREDLLKSVRRRFAIQMSTLLIDSNFAVDTAPGAQSAISLIQLRSDLQGLVRRVAKLVENSVSTSYSLSELDAAGVLQRRMVPAPGPHDVKGLRVAGWFAPADTCAGDWWMVSELGADDTLVCLGDVTGHGAASAIVSGIVKGAVDLAKLGMRSALKPYQLTRMVNTVIAEGLNGEYLMTAVICRYSPEQGLVSLANAGHRSVWHIRDKHLTVIPGTGAPPLGVKPVFRYEEQTVKVQSGDKLVLFTDGIPECESPDGAEMGERPLRDLLEAMGSEPPQTMLDAAQNMVAEFTGRNAIQKDDFTILVVEIL